MADDRVVRRSDSGSWWVAEDPETGVTAQGLRREAALENLEEKLAGGHEDPTPPDSEEERVESEAVIADLRGDSTPWGAGEDASEGRSRLRKLLDRLRDWVGNEPDRRE